MFQEIKKVNPLNVIDYDLDEHIWDSREGSYVEKNPVDKSSDVKDSWPAYICMKDESLIIFKGALTLTHCSIEKEGCIGWGRIDVNKWVCYNKAGIDHDCTRILRETLSV